MKQLQLLISLISITTLGYGQIQLGQAMEGEAAQDVSGKGLALTADGITLAIGAKFNDGNGSDAGHVRIYDWNGTAWVQRGLDIDGESAGDNFGWAVAINSDGNTVAIGAFLNDGIAGSNSGHVRIFDWNGISWAQRGVDIDGAGINDQFGYSVSIDAAGNTVAIGATDHTANFSQQGHVTVYTWNGVSWIQKGSDLLGIAAHDRMGTSVDLTRDGNSLVISAKDFNGIGNYRGLVQVFDWSGTAWVQKGANIIGKLDWEQFGADVAINDNATVIAAGLPFNSSIPSFEGAARVYHWSGSAWVQVGTDIIGEGARDYFGNSLDLNSAGDILIVGAYDNSAGGHARVYKRNSNSWLQLGSDIDGVGANDRAGSDVSIDSSGSIVSVGSISSSSSQRYAGHARVFDVSFLVGIAESETAEKIRFISPNPFKESFSVNFMQAESGLLKIRDASAKLIQQQFFTSLNKVSVSIEGPKGIYFVEIELNSNQRILKKVIKR